MTAPFNQPVSTSDMPAFLFWSMRIEYKHEQVVIRQWSRAGTEVLIETQTLGM